MRFGSVCSGIEAASLAWELLGWRAAFFSEIEKFPCAVLAHHYPTVPNFGDLNAFATWPDASIDILVGGTPCQSFSVAGLRGGMADPRGQLGMAQETAEDAADRAERFEAGLDRAVARLNEVSDDAANAQRIAAANRAAASYAPAEAERPAAGGLSYFSAPKLSIVENSIVASGRFYNGGDAPARGILYLDLVRDGEVLDTAEQRIIANQKSWGTWQQQFHFTRRGNGQVSVVPRFEAE